MNRWLSSTCRRHAPALLYFNAGPISPITRYTVLWSRNSPQPELPLGVLRQSHLECFETTVSDIRAGTQKHAVNLVMSAVGRNELDAKLHAVSGVFAAMCFIENSKFRPHVGSLFW